MCASVDVIVTELKSAVYSCVMRMNCFVVAVGEFNPSFPKPGLLVHF